MSNIAIVVGCNGQDGTLLSSYLFSKGMTVLGINRNKIINLDSNKTNNFSILKKEDVNDLVKNFEIVEIYYLASNNSSSEKNQKYLNQDIFQKKSYEVNVSGVSNFLEAMKNYSIRSKLFYASTSHIFGDSNGELQDESTDINPDSIYGHTKADGTLMCQDYRFNHGLNVSCGILFNHESSLRDQSYVSAKIINTAIDIAENNHRSLELGSPQSKVDWSYANDFIPAFHKIMQLDKSEDFILASGSANSVEDFAKEVFKIFSLDYKNFIKTNPSILERSPGYKIGNPSKLYKHTGIDLRKPFKRLIYTLVIDFLKMYDKKHLIKHYEN